MQHQSILKYHNNDLNMDNSKESLEKLAQNLLFEKQYISSPSLYNGWAGYAVTLFEISRQLSNEKLEEEAFLLIQKALIVQLDDYSFDTGYAGIGYALMHLIQEHFLDADFQEIFGEKLNQTIHHFSDLDFRPMELLSNYKLPLFLSSLPDIRNPNLKELSEKVFSGLELYLSLQFHDWRDVAYIGNRRFVLHVFRWYLLMILKEPQRIPSFYLLDSYCSLYLNNQVESSISVGVFLSQIGERHNKSLYKEVAQLHLHFSNSSRHLDYSQIPDTILDAELLIKNNYQGIQILQNIHSQLSAVPIWKGNNLLLYSNHIIHSNFIF